MSVLRNAVITVLLTFAIQASGYAQPDYQLEFLTTATGTFRWSAGTSALMTIAPNGTEVFLGGGESFSSFDDFLEGTVGQWTLVDFVGNEATFVVSSFSESLFAQDVELINPMDGQTIVSGAPINYMVISEQADFLGIGVSFSNEEIDVDFETGQIMILTLMDGVNESFPLVRGRGGNFVGDLVSDINDGETSITVSNDIRFVGESPIAEVRVIRNSIVGDVNRDGTVDLLDVVPFVDVLTNSEYQFEADIDGNGIVDLLDVTPFIGLLQ